MHGRNRKRQDVEKTDRERVRLDDGAIEQAAPRNKYYLSVARRYNFAKYLVLICLMCFLLVSLMANRENITYENFLLLIKDVNLAARTANREYETITYSEDAEQTVLKYKNNVVVAGASGVQIFSGTGEKVYSGKEKFSKPFAVSSDKYLLVYDFGGTKFSLYNTFACVFSDSFEYGITDGAISDSGTFALVTRTKEHNHAVMVYSRNCNLINRYRGNEYVLDVAISDEGDRIAMVKVEAEDGRYSSTLMICEPGEDDVVASLTFSDVFPVKCAFSDDGDLALICDREIYFYDKNGNLIGNYPISGEMSNIACEGGYVALVVGDGSVQTDNTVTVLDYKGGVVLEESVLGRISDVELLGGELFILTDTNLSRISVSGGKKREKEVEGYSKVLIVFGRDDVMLCTATKAEHIDMEE